MHVEAQSSAVRPLQGSGSQGHARGEIATVFLIESEVHTQQSLQGFLATAGMRVEAYSRGRDFLSSLQGSCRGCVVMNARLSDVDCVSVLEELATLGVEMPVILYGRKGKQLSVVRPMPVDRRYGHSGDAFGLAVIDRVTHALTIEDASRVQRDSVGRACARLAELSRRELQVAQKVIAGCASKVIAFDLSISERTVETHRRRVMEKTGCDSVAGLVWLFAASGLHEGAANWPIDELRRFVHARAEPDRETA